MTTSSSDEKCAQVPAASGAQGGALPWRCFHCDEVFDDHAAAALHFGHTCIETPVCQIDAARIREMEKTLSAYRNEDTELHRQISHLQSEHQQALRREEEKGYNRGLRDGRQLPWRTDDPPKDGSRFVAVGQICWHEEDRGGVIPFCAAVHWYQEHNLWLGEDELALSSDPDDTVRIHFWLPYPEVTR